MICQNAVAKPIAAMPADISTTPPTRKPRAPWRSTRKPTGVCNNAVVADIRASARPSSAKLTWNVACQAMNSGGRHST